MSVSKAKVIRQRIKSELGLNSRQVSVRSKPCTYSTAIDVTIKVPVAKSKVEAIVKEQESIARCEYSGEILSGGNTYTSVEYGEGVLDHITDAPEVVAAYEAAEEKVGYEQELPGGFKVYKVSGQPYYFWLDHESFPYSKKSWGSEHSRNVYAECRLEAEAAAEEKKAAA